MDLRAVRGIGPTYEEKLRSAGISTAEEFAWVADLSELSERTTIPPARLAGLQAEAVRSLGRGGRPAANALRDVMVSLMELGRAVFSARRRAEKED